MASVQISHLPFIALTQASAEARLSPGKRTDTQHKAHTHTHKQDHYIVKMSVRPRGPRKLHCMLVAVLISVLLTVALAQRDTALAGR